MEYIILLKGINVGGHNIVKMSDLKLKLREFGFCNIKSYIQSGNIILSSDLTSKELIESEISSILYKDFSVESSVFVLTRDEFLKLKDLNPFTNNEFELKNIHYIFLKNRIDSNNIKEIKDKLLDVKDITEEFYIYDEIIILHAPGGIGRSKFITKVSNIVNDLVTIRNLRSVTKIANLI